MFEVNITGKPLPTDRKIPVAIHGRKSTINQWHIPEEVPVAFVYNRRNYALMFATPADLVEYAAGFSLSERVAKTIDDILRLDIVHSDKGIDFRIQIKPHQIEKLDILQRRRNLVGSVSCGLCGLENADTLFQPLPRVCEKKATIDIRIIARAMEMLCEHQPINNRTHSVHGAGWANMDGEILFLREDVGRHNALDKLLGVLSIEAIDIKQGFVIMSSRCSYELVEKVAHHGVRALATISGPTGFALEKAKEANVSLFFRSKTGAVEAVE